MEANQLLEADQLVADQSLEADQLVADQSLEADQLEADQLEAAKERLRNFFGTESPYGIHGTKNLTRPKSAHRIKRHFLFSKREKKNKDKNISANRCGKNISLPFLLIAFITKLFITYHHFNRRILGKWEEWKWDFQLISSFITCLILIVLIFFVLYHRRIKKTKKKTIGKSS